jgi:hypothetical protein
MIPTFMRAGGTTSSMAFSVGVLFEIDFSLHSNSGQLHSGNRIIYALNGS